jgi:hypothetical protein
MPRPFRSAVACWLLACAVAWLLPACQRTEAVASNAPPGSEVIRFDRNGDRVPRDAAGAFAAGQALLLPQEFPDDVYLPGRYAVHSVMDMPGVQVVSLFAPGDVSALSRDARTAMQHDGWTRRMAAQHSVDNAVLAFEKDGRSALLAFNRNVRADGVPDAGVIVSVQLQDRSVLQ